CQQGKSNPFTF
nr:immunoglobulin light chain junction region [Macaca mulatta]MOV34436.1 immunoglobulin light chain junction region [Macaca mulatta]MOV35162.1 immunoglobulin light chain junction region [Macaca mulatta]MOV35429.1 immunoglobulin light chain junction region [Macaca mulatta]